MKSTAIFCILTLLLFTGCNEDPVIPEIVNELEFSCPSENSNSYFEGYLMDNYFCYKDSVDGYRLQVSTSMEFTTADPSLPVNPNSLIPIAWANLGFSPYIEYIHNINGDPFPHLKHYILIETPVDTNDLTLEEFIERNFTKVGNLPIQSEIIDPFHGFNIVFRFNDLEANKSRIFETLGGQQTDSHLTITNLHIDNLHSGLTSYSITFEFGCNLYYRGKPDKYFTKIENGKMEINFIL